MKREAIDNTLSTQENCVISPPKFATTDFYVEGIAPLVIAVQQKSRTHGKNG